MDKTNLTADQQLLFRVSQGNEQAFQQLVNRYSGKVFFHAMTFVKTWHQAEELTHDIFLHIWQKREKLLQVEHLDNYIFIVSKNFLLSYIRKKVRHFDLSEPGEETGFAESAAAKYENKELAQLLEKAISHLPDQKQQVFRMIHQEGLSQHEVAQKLGIATRTVRWNLISAINGIKDYLHRYSLGDLFFVFLVWRFF